MNLENNITKEELESNCEAWLLTHHLRWIETDLYNPITDSFELVLQQKHVSTKGAEEWRDVDVYVRESSTPKQ